MYLSKQFFPFKFMFALVAFQKLMNIQTDD